MTVRRAAKGAGVTDAHVAVPMLGIASGLIGVARRIRASTSWLEPCTMWCGIVGFSGTGKTPGLEVTKRALAAVEREKRDDLAELRRKHDSKVEAARAARAAWKKQVEAAVENGGIPPEMPKEAQDPGKFVAPKLYVSDGTIERMGELLTARPQGIIRILDELACLKAATASGCRRSPPMCCGWREQFASSTGLGTRRRRRSRSRSMPSTCNER